MTCQCLTDYVKVAFPHDDTFLNDDDDDEHIITHSDDDDTFIDLGAFIEPDDPDYY